MELSRSELKFMITYDEYYKLRQELRLLCVLDSHADEQSGEYHISSLYFDDIYDSHVFEKADGIESHQKFRIRTYGNQRKRLEYKTKSGQLTSKQQLWLTDEFSTAIEHQDYGKLYPMISEPLIEQMVIRMKLDHLKPSIWIEYDREAYLYSAGDTRITFDKNIQAKTYGRDISILRNVLEPKMMILEVKFNGILPDRISKVIFHRNYQIVSYSKYYLGFLMTQI